MGKSWDDDDDVPSQNEPIAVPDLSPYTEATIMRFGQKHSGEMLSKVPTQYLQWYLDNVSNQDPRLVHYIYNRLNNA